MSVADWFGGTDKQQRYNDPTLLGWTNYLWDNADPGLGYFGKRDKQIGKFLAEGKDVSDLGELNSISQMHAANRRDIADQGAYGANALIAAGGGENANILNRATQQNLDRDYERMGQEYGQGVSNLRSNAEAGFNAARQQRINAELANRQLALGARQAYNQNQYDWIQKKGLFPTLAGMAAQAAPFF